MSQPPDEAEAEYRARRKRLKSAAPKETPARHRYKHQKDREYRDALKELKVQMPVGRAKAEHVRIMKQLKDNLQETWHNVCDKFDDFKHFTEKQHLFAKHYAANGRRSKLEAMLKAGYNSPHHRVLIQNANATLARPGFEELIRAFELEGKARMKIAVEDVVKWFNDIATAAMAAGDFTNANRSMESLAKYLGMFIERKEVTHRVVQNKEELDARIKELTEVLRETEPEIEARLRTH